MDPDTSLEATLAAVADVRPDLVALTGDLSDDGSVAALQRLRDLIAEVGAPMLALAGNHDDPVNVSEVFGSRRTAEVGSWRVVGVETFVKRRNHGAVDVVALTALLDGLDQRPTLVAMHHGPRSPSTHRWFRLLGGEALLEALAQRPHVRAIVSGHLHEVFRYHENGLELCGAPSSWYAIEHVGDSYELAPDGLVGAQVITLGDDGSFACQPVARSLGC
jgi:Icc protein